MNKKISELKGQARTALEGNYAFPVWAFLLIGVINSICSSLSVTLFSGQSTYAMVMSNLFTFILSLITSVLMVGWYYCFLKISRGEKAGYGDLIYMFRHHPDRVILVSVILVGVQYIFMIPGVILSYQIAGSYITDVKDTFLQIVIMYLATMAGILVAGLITMPLAMSYYLLIDHEEMGAKEAILGSLRLMKGHYGQYFYMMVSFAGLLLLGILSLYIGLIWVIPYIQMTQIQFYQELIGEVKEVAPEKREQTISNPSDGYNAEA